MKKSMASPNVKIITELKNYLDEISTDPVKRMAYVYSSKDFTRRRVLCFKTLILFITNAIKRSLSVELNDYFWNLSCEVSCSKPSARHEGNSGLCSLITGMILLYRPIIATTLTKHTDGRDFICYL